MNPSRRSAADRSSVSVSGLGNGDAVEPRGLRSRDAVRRVFDREARAPGSTPSAAHAARYASGAGFPRASPVARDGRCANRARSPSRSRCPSTQSEGELDAIARPRPAASASSSHSTHCRAARPPPRASGVAVRHAARRVHRAEIDRHPRPVRPGMLDELGVVGVGADLRRPLLDRRRRRAVRLEHRPPRLEYRRFRVEHQAVEVEDDCVDREAHRVTGGAASGGKGSIGSIGLASETPPSAATIWPVTQSSVHSATAACADLARGPDPAHARANGPRPARDSRAARRWRRTSACRWFPAPRHSPVCRAVRARGPRRAPAPRGPPSIRNSAPSTGR